MKNELRKWKAIFKTLSLCFSKSIKQLLPFSQNVKRKLNYELFPFLFSVSEKRKQKTKGFTRNIQIAVNSVNQCVEMITKMGIQATVETDDQDNELRMIIHLPK